MRASGFPDRLQRADLRRCGREEQPGNVPERLVRALKPVRTARTARLDSA